MKTSFGKCNLSSRKFKDIHSQQKLDVEFKESGFQSDIYSVNGLILNFSQR